MKFLTVLDLQKNELQNATIQNLATDPASPVQGQIYYNTASDVIKVYDGAAWQTLSTGGGTVTSVGASSPLSSTGGTTPTISIQDGTTTQKGAVQLENSTSSTSTTTAAVPASVKAAYDLAAGKASTSNKLSDFAATTSAELAGVISDETGSGALVFANSPTLVTPALGTPSSVTLTNASGLPISTGVSGLGTNVATFLGTPSSANLASAVSDETGTGALVFANTPTLVTPNIGAATGTSLVLSGDLTVNGTTTTINSTTLTVDDKNIELGSTAEPSDASADGGGITLKGTTDKTINWVDATDAWTLSEHVNIANGKVYRINGTEVLSGSALGSGVTGSSLTSVGTITSGTWNGSDIAVADGGTGASDAAGAKTNLGFMTRYSTSATWTTGESKAVTHSLGTKDVVVAIYDSSDNAVFADVVTTSTSVATITISLAGTYRVVIIG